MSELLPCPICGGKAEIAEFDPPLRRPARNHPYTVYCPGCELLFGWDVDYGGTFDTPEEASAAWNRRYKEG